MTSAKKYVSFCFRGSYFYDPSFWLLFQLFQGIQEFTTKLPDFLLQFVDANIRNDTYGALRSTHLSHKIDDLIPQQLQAQATFWIFIDPLGTDHLLINADEFSRLSKASESLPKKDKQLQFTTKQSYLSLQFEPKNVLSTLLKDEKLSYVSMIKMVTMDEIRLKCEANLYFQPQELITDIRNVIAWNQTYRASSKRSFIHLSNFYGKFIQLIAKRKFISKFFEKKNKDFQELQKLEQQFKLSTSSWPWIPKKFRQYEPLEDYVPTPANRTKIIEQRLKSEKIPVQCPDNCVCYRKDLKNDEQFCSYSLADVWYSQCPNRKARIECCHIDSDKASSCRNSQIKNKKRKTVKQTGEDEDCQIQQYMAWGIDLYTRNFIFNCLPQIDILGYNESQRNTENKNKFIQSSLQKALNFLGERGFDIGEACKFIIQNGSTMEYCNNFDSKKFFWRSISVQRKQISSSTNIFTSLDAQYASNLLKNKNYADQQFPLNQYFRIHTKGKGAKCVAKQGIKRGTFIVEYFGQIYQPWRWYEREDFIKEVLKKKKLKQVIPQFYNIYLQKHKDEPLGYDIVVVDPIKKGNFSSRFSHSCTPNCGTVSTISDGKYVIGMYSIKDISYGEELTFDYCSMTESSYEHTHSICLCGTKQCRGNYLQLANNKIYNNLMDSNSCFHYRNSLMLRSLGEVTQKQLEICSNSNIKSGILKSLPDWLIKWCSIILQSIERQGQVYGLQLKQTWTKQYPWQSKNETEEQKQQKIQLYAQISKNDLINLRYQNLITTIDKIKYYLESIDDKNPPLQYQSNERICEVLIENASKDSVLILLEDELTNQKLKQEIQLIEDFLIKIKSIDIQLQTMIHSTDQITKEQLLKRKQFYFRLCCLCVSHQILCKSNGSTNNRFLLSDIVYFYAFTHTYFKPHEYKTHTSEQIKVTLQQILGESCASKFSDKTRKRYTSPCVWGQMVAWFKQTIINPEASLSQDRRGTLSYPLINSILKSTYPFQKRARPSFMRSIREKPASSWPPASSCELSYKNPYKCYGTVLFQHVHNRDVFKQLPKGNLLDSVLDVINMSLGQKLMLFKQVEFIIEKIPENSELYDVLDRLNLNYQQTPIIQIPEEAQKKVGKKKVKLQKKLQDQSEKSFSKSDHSQKANSQSKQILMEQKQQQEQKEPKEQNFEE